MIITNKEGNNTETNMTEEQKEQIAAEIDNQGFEYWLTNYASSSLPENNAPQALIDVANKAAVALEEAEALFIKYDLFL